MKYAQREEGRAQQLVERGVSFIEQGALLEAEASFRVSAELTQNPAAYDGIACVKFLKKDIIGAEKVWRQVMRWFPEYLPAYANFAILLDLMGKKEAAKRYYQYVIERDPANFMVRNNFGAMLREQDKENLAQSFFFDSYVLSENTVSKANILKRVR